MGETHDLVIIGAGPAGYTAAIRAAQLGLDTAIVDDRLREGKPAPGGVCLNVGCIPSKALLSISEEYYSIKTTGKKKGITHRDLGFNLARMMKRKEGIIQKLTGGVLSLLGANGIRLYSGTASLSNPGKVEVESGSGVTQLLAEKIILATGSLPRELPFLPCDGRRVIDSTGALSLEEVPPRLLIIGAGAIGLEMGSVWSRLGSEVTVLELASQVLPGWDRSLARELQGAMKKQGLTIRLSTAIEGGEVGKGGVRLWGREEGKDPFTLEGDLLLVAAGRLPRVSIAGVGSREFLLTDRGFLQVDEGFQTSIPGIYAVGDVIPGPMLAHKAEEEGIALAEKLAGLPGLHSRHTIPGVVYTHPEGAFVGSTEESLIAEDRPYLKGTFPFAANGRALAMGEEGGFVKILADAATDRLLGAHILGPSASELIAQAVTVMEFGGSAEDIARTIHAHPSLSEAMKEASLAVADRSIHTINRKK